MSLDCKKPKACKPDEKPREIYPPPTEAFDFCVGDYTVSWDGTRLRRERHRQTPDGTYSNITLVNGCITDYGYCDEPIYTPPYCNPSPGSCQDTGGNSTGGSGGSVTISPHKDNTLSTTPAGLFARTYVKAGDNISVTGTGTVNNPYVVSASTTASGGAGGAIIGRDGVKVTTSNTGVSYVSLEPSALPAGKYEAFTLDAYGRIVGYDTSESIKLAAGEGISITESIDGITIGHNVTDVDGTYQLGGYSLTMDRSGHITGIQRTTNLEAGTYNLGAYNVTVDEFGGVTKIQQLQVVEAAGSFKTADGKTVSFDATGRIIDVQEPAVPVPIPPISRVRFLQVLTVAGPKLFDFRDNDPNREFALKSYSTQSLTVRLPPTVTSVDQLNIEFLIWTPADNGHDGVTFTESERGDVVAFNAAINDDGDLVLTPKRKYWVSYYLGQNYDAPFLLTIEVKG